MPIYVYQATEESKGCASCRDSFEEFQSMSEDELKKCQSCDGPVRRVITAQKC